MEKAADSGCGEKQKREDKAMVEEESPFPQSKFSEEDLKILVEKSLVQPRSWFIGGVL